MSMGYDLKNIYELTNCNIRPSTPLSKQSIITVYSIDIHTSWNICAMPLVMRILTIKNKQRAIR